MYCPSYFEDNSIYKNEINKFSDIVKRDKIQFSSLTYYDLFVTLYQNVSKANYANGMSYLNYNMIKYL